jgi:hypothetical protein
MYLPLGKQKNGWLNILWLSPTMYFWKEISEIKRDKSLSDISYSEWCEKIWCSED